MREHEQIADVQQHDFCANRKQWFGRQYGRLPFDKRKVRQLFSQILQGCVEASKIVPQVNNTTSARPALYSMSNNTSRRSRF
jgi:hypothetical protein